jgi:CheY-like chemotaxis protein
VKSFRTPGGHRRIRREDLIAFLKGQNMPVDDELLGRHKRVLIVDDEEAVASAIAKLVSQMDGTVEVEVAHSGFDAGRLLQSFEPDVVLLDLKMPDLDGFEVCRQIKAHPDTRHVKVIGMTGYYSDEEADEVIRQGAAMCLRKPISFETLQETIGAVLVSSPA